MQRLGYTFQEESLLLRALTHPSYLQVHPEAGASNQRLEFLGDAVLNLILAEALFAKLPQKREGVLTKARASLARGSTLTRLARELDLAPHLRLAEADHAIRARGQASILEDALEAVIGAIYLDSDFPTTRDVVLVWYGDINAALEESLAKDDNPKSRLQETVQASHGNDALRYEITGVHGPDHARTFTARVLLLGEERGTGTGASKQAAEKAAARKALATLEADR